MAPPYFMNINSITLERVSKLAFRKFAKKICCFTLWRSHVEAIPLQEYAKKKKKKMPVEVLYFSVKSAGVLFENWKVFCFVIGDVELIPPVY